MPTLPDTVMNLQPVEEKRIVFEPICIPRAPNTGMGISYLERGAGDLFYSASPHRNLHKLQLTQEKLKRGFWKNEGEWTRQVEFRQEEIPRNRLSMHDYVLTYSRL